MLGGHLRRHPGAIGYVEVPDTHRILAEGAFWDLYYEHCSYFTAATLRSLLERSGLEVSREDLGFNDQYVQIECSAESGSNTKPGVGPDAAADVAVQVTAFANRMTTLRDQWRSTFDDWARSGKRAVLWGGGSKAVAFIATLELGTDVDGVIDINPRKQRGYLPSSGHQVLGPDSLDADPPDVVVVMNPVYLDEIRTDLAARGLSPEVLAA
jgi:hypothetical protein